MTIQEFKNNKEYHKRLFGRNKSKQNPLIEHIANLDTGFKEYDGKRIYSIEYLALQQIKSQCIFDETITDIMKKAYFDASIDDDHLTHLNLLNCQINFPLSLSKTVSLLVLRFVLLVRKTLSSLTTNAS